MTQHTKLHLDQFSPLSQQRVPIFYNMHQNEIHVQTKKLIAAINTIFKIIIALQFHVKPWLKSELYNLMLVS